MFLDSLELIAYLGPWYLVVGFDFAAKKHD